MIEVRTIDANIYEKFLFNHKMRHFLQSSSWGELAKEKKGLTPHYLGFYEDDNIVGSVLLLEKKLPFKYSYFYAPRGFLGDYENFNVLNLMTKSLVKYIKEKRGIFLKIDPPFIYKNYDYLNNEIECNTDIIYSNLKKCGFKHLGFTKNFETSQPRYTFRINLEQDIETIYEHFSKTTKQRINKAIKLGSYVELGEYKDLESFYNLMRLTEDRKDFVTYKLDYYQKLFTLFNNYNNTKAKLYLGKINFSKTINNLNNRLEALNKEIASLNKKNNKKKDLLRQKNDLIKEINKYENYQKEYGETITLSAHMVITYNDISWVLYAGNHNILSETYVNYLTYFQHIKDSKENGTITYDQFGTIGDLNKNNPLLGLHEFKKKFGGNYIEFLGEWDYPVNKFMYFIFTKLIPIYRGIIKKIRRNNLHNNVNKKAS